MFKLEIETDNEAFAADRGIELADILRRLARTLDPGLHTSGGACVRDSNGNRVGCWLYVEESSE